MVSLTPLPPLAFRGLFAALPSRLRRPDGVRALTPPCPAPPQPQAKPKKLTKRKQTLKFSIDCSQPVDDGIMDAASFVSETRGDERAHAPLPRALSLSLRHTAARSLERERALAAASASAAVC